MIQHCRTGERAWERHREYLPNGRGGAAGHHDDTVGQEQGLIDIVGDHHHGFAVLVPESHELILEFHAGEGIKETEGLIEQQDFGLESKSTGNTDALTHTGRQLIGVTVSHLRQAHEPEVVFGQASLSAAARERGRGKGTVSISPTVAAGPLVIMTTRSARSRASSTSWVTITTVLRSSSHSRMSSS